MKKYQVAADAGAWEVSPDQLAALDLVPSGAGRYHLLHAGKSYDLRVVTLDVDAKTIHLQVDGRDHHLQLRDEIDQLVDQLGFAASTTAVRKDVLAPMPGLILDVLVREGEEVTAGTPLIILEAMKMENVLKAEGDGTVGSIPVAKGEAVEKRQLLIEIS